MSTAYSASKAGVLGFTRALSADVAPWGITCNAISPGMVATSRVLLSLDPDIDVEAEIKRRGSMLAVGRSGYPEDIAAAVAYLASDGAGYMTGQTLVLDGGGAGSMMAKKPPEASKLVKPRSRGFRTGSASSGRRSVSATAGFAAKYACRGPGHGMPAALLPADQCYRRPARPTARGRHQGARTPAASWS